MKQSRPVPHGPFSRLVSLDSLAALPDGRIKIAATEEECAALAKLNNIIGINGLEADFHILVQPREVVLSGEVKARVTQVCVVTLDPFESNLRTPIDIRFAPQPDLPAARRRDAERIAPTDHDALGDDPPEPLVGDHIDLGALAAEFFSLGLDPYPRKPGAQFESAGDERAEAAGGLTQENPFAALAKLRKPDPEGAA